MSLKKKSVQIAEFHPLHVSVCFGNSDRGCNGQAILGSGKEISPDIRYAPTSPLVNGWVHLLRLGSVCPANISCSSELVGVLRCGGKGRRVLTCYHVTKLVFSTCSNITL